MGSYQASVRGPQDQGAAAVSPLPNQRVNAAYSAVTARAHCGTRLARGRAGYAQR